MQFSQKIVPCLWFASEAEEAARYYTGIFPDSKIGKIARPAAVLFGEDLPKTRSGKIMRRLLKNIAEGDELGDTTTLRDPAIVDDLKEKADRALGRS